MSQLRITRRSALTGAAVAPLALTASLTNAGADGHAAGKPVPFSSFKLGSAEVITLLDGARTADEPQGTFGMNVSPEAFAEASREAFIPTDKTRFFFTPVVVRSGEDVTLFDTGLGGDNGNLMGALASAGIAPEAVTTVVITHMHPDHIGGLMGGNPFSNASFVFGAKEYDFWSSMEAGNRVGDMVAKGITPLAEKAKMIQPGETAASGITAMEAYGHTPGHMVYTIESDGQTMLLAADTANHYVWSLAYPDWEVRFDADKEAAAATRRKIFGMVASERIPFTGYHMPFPAVGYVEANGDTFRYVPESYQLEL